MSESAGRTSRDRRRRSLGQNFLVDRNLIRRWTDGLDLGVGDLVVELGAGSGALTVLLAATGATVWAIEPDPHWAVKLRSDPRLADADVRVLEADAQRVRLPKVPYRVVANLPFGQTTSLMGHLFDDPRRGPERADLVLQHEVARKHCCSPPVALRTAAWAPWWQFELGEVISRRSFRPQPSVDAAIVTVRRRSPPVLPERLADGFAETLRPAWTRQIANTRTERTR